MKNPFHRLRLAYLKWRHPLREVPKVGHPEETALVRQPSQDVHTEVSTDDLARAYVRQEFDRLLGEASTEYLSIPLINVARPDESSTEHKWQWDWEGKAGREWQSISLSIKHDGMLRIVAGTSLADPIFLTMVAHRSTPIEVNISSLLYASAADKVTVWCFSSEPFEVTHVRASLRLAPEVIQAFREKTMREEGCTRSIPAPDSLYGEAFYRAYPEMLP